MTELIVGQDGSAILPGSTIGSFTKGKELTTYPTNKGFGVTYLTSVVDAVKMYQDVSRRVYDGADKYRLTMKVQARLPVRNDRKLVQKT